MSRTHMSGRWGLALASATVLAFALGGTAHAQHRTGAAHGCTVGLDANGSFTSSCATAPSATETAAPAISQAPQRYALVTRNNLTGGVRAPMKGDNDVGIISLADFRAQHLGSDAEFTAMESQNRQACGRTGTWIRQSLWIHSQVQSMGPEWDRIGIELAKLGDAQNRVSWGRRGFEAIAAGLLCAIPGVGWHYCAASIASEAAGELNGHASDRANKLNRRQSQLNVRQSQLNLAATDLWTEENIAWDEMFQGYCLQLFPDETIGYTDKSVMPREPVMSTSWGYWNDPERR